MPSGSGRRGARIHTSCAVVAAATIALAPNVEVLASAAPEPKRLQWYEYGDSSLGGHGFGCDSFDSCDPALPAFEDHRAWLKEHV
jgi:hypothetical protein